MRITNAKFITSATKKEDMPRTNAPEIAVAGRSNVGKSSFINFIANNGKLCRTSSEPGRTRLVNYFEMNSGQFYFIDLPGYGYAKVGKDEQAKWAKGIQDYFEYSEDLKHVFVLVDVRREPSDLDLVLINMLIAYSLPFTVIGTKADKLSKVQLSSNIGAIASRLKIGRDNVIPTSASAKMGKESVLDKIEQIIGVTENIE
jgi:GTP-binding protein